MLNKSEVEEDSDLVEDVEAGKKTKQSSGKVYEQRDEEKLSLIDQSQKLAETIFQF